MKHCNCTACIFLDRLFTVPWTGKHEFSHPFKQIFYRVWFCIPRYIWQKNWEGIEFMIQPDGTRSKPKPFLGMVFEKTEGEMYRIAWWKHHIKFVKHD